MKTQKYQDNEQPKLGDLVRTNRDMEEGVDRLYVVTSVLGGRMGNKVGLQLVNGQESNELYYYCLCPQ